jgi:hypothetical protein
MAEASNPKLSFGIIAEDQTDCEALKVIIRRVLGDGATEGSLRSRSANGCGTLRRKAAAWMNELADKGCSAIILVHDCDRDPLNGELRDEEALRKQLESIAYPAWVRRTICIPVEELEAWFWSDPAVVTRVGRGEGKASASPHLIRKPKEELQRLSKAANGKPRYSTNDNAELAALLDLALCARRCASFRQLVDFIKAVSPAARGNTPPSFAAE